MRKTILSMRFDSFERYKTKQKKAMEKEEKEKKKVETMERQKSEWGKEL